MFPLVVTSFTVGIKRWKERPWGWRESECVCEWERGWPSPGKLPLPEVKNGDLRIFCLKSSDLINFPHLKHPTLESTAIVTVAGNVPILQRRIRFGLRNSTKYADTRTLSYEGALTITVIFVENETGIPSSNPQRNCFTSF